MNLFFGSWYLSQIEWIDLTIPYCLINQMFRLKTIHDVRIILYRIVKLVPLFWYNYKW